MKFAVFIRNVMVGRKGLTRDLLVASFARSGARNVASYLATGNVIFSADNGSAPDIVARVFQSLSADIGLQEPMFLRSLDYLAQLESSHPFADAPMDNIYEQCVTFLPDGFPDFDIRPARSPRRDVELIARVQAEAFSVTRMIKGRSGYAGELLERERGMLVTTRNWKTVTRLIAKFATR